MKKEISVVNVLSNLYTDYNRHVDSYRALPHANDCFKVLERRNIYTLFLMKKRKSNSTTVVGNAKSLHPHGDTVIYQNLVNLVHRNFAIGEGNWGSYGYDENAPAHQRYTSLKINDKICTFFEKLMNEKDELIPFINNESGDNDDIKEPLYIPSPISLGLIGNTITFGIGGTYACKIPQYTVQDLYKRLKYLLTNNPEDDVKIKPNITGCDILEDEENAFNKILTTGHGKIIVAPRVEKGKNKLIIHGRDPIFGFGVEIKGKNPDINSIDTNTLKGYNQFCELKFGKEYARCKDDLKPSKAILDKNCIEVVVEPNTGIKFDDEFYNTIKKLISKKITISCNVVNDDNIVQLMSIDQLLLKSYTNWLNAIKKDLILKKNTEEQKLFELQCLELAKQIYDNRIKKGSMTLIDDILEDFTKYYKESKFTVNDIDKVINKLSVRKFINIKVEPTTIIENIKSLQYTIDNSETICKNQIINICEKL